MCTDHPVAPEAHVAIPPSHQVHSTILWHLKREVPLCYLAKRALDFERTSPYACCVVGNCFSLQKVAAAQQHSTAMPSPPHHIITPHHTTPHHHTITPSHHTTPPQCPIRHHEAKPPLVYRNPLYKQIRLLFYGLFLSLVCFRRLLYDDATTRTTTTTTTTTGYYYYCYYCYHCYCCCCCCCCCYCYCHYNCHYCYLQVLLHPFTTGPCLAPHSHCRSGAHRLYTSGARSERRKSAQHCVIRSCQ